MVREAPRERPLPSVRVSFLGQKKRRQSQEGLQGRRDGLCEDETVLDPGRACAAGSSLLLRQVECGCHHLRIGPSGPPWAGPASLAGSTSGPWSLHPLHPGILGTRLIYVHFSLLEHIPLNTRTVSSSSVVSS